MIPLVEGMEEPEIPPILTDRWDSSYNDNDCTNALNLSGVETGGESDLETGISSGLQRSAELVPRSDLSLEDLDTENEYLAIEKKCMKPQECKDIKSSI